MFSNCGNNPEAKGRRKKRVEVPVIQLTQTDTFLHKRYVGRIEAVRNVEIRNKVEGYLDTIYVDEGDEVRSGQLLFAIHTEEFRTAIAKANAVLSNANAEAKEAEVKLNRVKLLVDKKVISPTELEVAEAAYRSKLARIDEAQSVLANANTHLAYTYIRAPFHGVINRIPFKVGSLLTEGSFLTSVSDISAVNVYFNVAEDEYLRYLRDQNKNISRSNVVTLRLADGTTYSHPGKIETTTSEFDTGTGSIAFRAQFPNPDKLLRHGASGEVVLQTKADNVLLVPQKSAFEIQDRNYVYVVGAGDTIKMKSFNPESRIAGFYIVKSGLKAGDRIVYEGTQSLKDGAVVKPSERNMNELMRKDEEDSEPFAQFQ